MSDNKIHTKKSVITILGVLLTIFGLNLLNSQPEMQQTVLAKLELKGGHWANRTITYSIKRGTENTVRNAWIKAANEINRYQLVNFILVQNGTVKLGQKISRDPDEIGSTQTWRRGNEYSRAEAYLSVNQSLKKQMGNNYAQRQYATALHELGHVLGLKHDSNPRGLMYAASQAWFTTLDQTSLAALKSIYGKSVKSISSKNITQSKQSYNNLLQVGTVKVNYVRGYGINLWASYGLKFTGRRLIHGSKWRFTQVVYKNGTYWYNVGKNQWLDGQYLLVS